MQVTEFEFRVNELRQRLQDEAKAGNAEARLKRDKADQGRFWKKEYIVEGFIEAQVDKVVSQWLCWSCTARVQPPITATTRCTAAWLQSRWRHRVWRSRRCAGG